jgi:hypothetical protein
VIQVEAACKLMEDKRNKVALEKAREIEIAYLSIVKA